MKLYCLAQGSSGNCYILENDNGKQLILDAGVKVKDITNSKAFKTWKNVEGVLITHSHKDHSLCEQSLGLTGIDVYSYKTFNKKNSIIKLENFIIVYFLQEKKIYDKQTRKYNYVPSHDVPCYGFIIKDKVSKKTLLYATDTSCLPKIKGDVNYWLIECNFDNETWERNVIKGLLDFNYLGRLFDTHLGLESICSYFEEDYKGNTPDLIIPCHLGPNLNYNRLNELNKYAKRVERAKKGECYIL